MQDAASLSPTDFSKAQMVETIDPATRSNTWTNRRYTAFLRQERALRGLRLWVLYWLDNPSGYKAMALARKLPFTTKAASFTRQQAICLCRRRNDLSGNKIGHNTRKEPSALPCVAVGQPRKQQFTLWLDRLQMLDHALWFIPGRRLRGDDKESLNPQSTLAGCSFCVEAVLVVWLDGLSPAVG